MVVQRVARDQRAPKIVELYLNGKTQDEIATELGISQAAVSDQLKRIREGWRESAHKQIGDWVTDEIAMCFKQRATNLELFSRTNNPKYDERAFAWSARIDNLIGLNSPVKTADWTSKDWEKYINEQVKSLGITDAEIANAAAAYMESLGNYRSEGPACSEDPVSESKV